ncbi:MAG: hypothetical protein AAGE43_01990 [Pseudomonadota bacterium]
MLTSDLDEAAQAALLDNLLRLERIAEPFLPGTPLVRGDALPVIVFSRRGDFVRLTGKRSFAGLMQPSLQTNRLLIGPIRGDLTETAQHEYVHFLLRNRDGASLPLWFDEGLASLLGKATLNADSARFEVLPSRLSALLSRDAATANPRRSLNRTLSLALLDELPSNQIEAFYDWSWLIADYLYFGVLEGAPVAGSTLEIYLADRSLSLPAHLGVSERALLRELERHLQRSKARSVAVGPAPAVERRFRCLEDSERDLALAEAIATQNPSRARELLAPHLSKVSEAEVSGAEVSENAETNASQQTADLFVAQARIERLEEQRAESESYVERALAAAPGHAGALIMSADLSAGNCIFDPQDDCPERWLKAAGLYRQALRQDPRRYDAVLGLGLSYLYRGQPGDAANYLKVAYQRAPWAPVVNYFIGESYRLTGDTRARRYLTNARNWAVADIWRVLAEESLRRLDEAAAGP